MFVCLQLAKIEEQQRAIHNLKTSLIDDLNARGVLSDPETQAVIKRHQEVGLFLSLSRLQMPFDSSTTDKF